MITATGVVTCVVFPPQVGVVTVSDSLSYMFYSVNAYIYRYVLSYHLIGSQDIIV